MSTWQALAALARHMRERTPLPDGIGDPAELLARAALEHRRMERFADEQFQQAREEAEMAERRATPVRPTLATVDGCDVRGLR